MKYEIYVIEYGVEKSTKKIVRAVERAVELCAVFSDMDAGPGNPSSYKEVQKNTRGLNMSCFVCRPEVFKSVTKVCFQYGLRQPNRTEYPLLQPELDAFTVKVAELNAKNVSIRYEEDAQAEVEGFTDIPLEKIKVQDF